MANTLSSLGGFLSAYMVGTLTKEDVSISFVKNIKFVTLKRLAINYIAKHTAKKIFKQKKFYFL